VKFGIEAANSIRVNREEISHIPNTRKNEKKQQNNLIYFHSN
jgi:sRNA-binding carbon storage regulator CsrA